MTTPVCRTEPSARGDSATAGRGAAGVNAASSGRSARLACDLRASRLLQLGVMLMAVQATLLLAISRLPWVLVALAIPLIIVFAVFEWRRVAASEGRLSTSDHRWYWHPKGGARRAFQFCGELTLWRWLIVINGRDADGRPLRLVLCRDGADASDWRRLQVALRYAR
ncbi:protein YgfX [Microbulbifer sp. Q7]|uniref:protein YgfX n=1 Tax=Microbulbifer sp. Q7 TaxID=1785091 RepID=UPI00082AFBE5|nr:protein YgfX [Microbulbifer sp. Q7]